MEKIAIDTRVQPPQDQIITKPENNKFAFFQALYFPFLQNSWFLKLWWLPFLTIFPPLAFCLLKGWRVNIVRRMCERNNELLPDFSDIFRFLLDGIVLVATTSLYAVVPACIIFVFALDGLVDFYNDIKTIYSIGSFSDLFSFIRSELVENILVLLIKYGWLLMSFPLYSAAFLRYCSTGKVSSFFTIPANVFFILKNFNSFIKLYLFLIVFTFLWVFLFTSLTLTGIGVVISPFMFPFYYWSTAYVFGCLAQNISK